MIPAPRIHVMDTAIIKAEPGKGCPRCGGVVFAAEEVLAKGRVSTQFKNNQICLFVIWTFLMFVLEQVKNKELEKKNNHIITVQLFG